MNTIVTDQVYADIKANKSLDDMNNLSRSNFKQYVIKFEYAKLLISNGEITLGKKLLLELIGTSNQNYAAFELGKLEVKQGNLDKARSYFESLFGTSSEAYALFELGKLEAMAGNMDKARYYLEILLYHYNNLLVYDLLIILEIKCQNYLRAFELIKEALANNVNINKKNILCVSKELNVFFENVKYNDVKYSYCVNQLLDYSEPLAMEHILEGHLKSKEKNNFDVNIDVPKLFQYVQRRVYDEYKLNKLVLNDIYIIPFDGVGSEGENYVKVVTTPNSRNIITMYPVFSVYENYDEEESSKELIKRYVW